jgi:hypothetical protein
MKLSLPPELKRTEIWGCYITSSVLERTNLGYYITSSALKRTKFGLLHSFIHPGKNKKLGLLQNIIHPGRKIIWAAT